MYTIPPDSPKAVKAAAFGRELIKACRARNVPLKELERVTGVGHTSLDNYRRGLNLPKVEVAVALAHTLDWPKLAEMIVAARTFACARKGCLRTFRNDTGAPHKYCTEMCRRIAENLRMASTRVRQAGQTGSKASANAAVRQLRSAIGIADERAQVVEGAIDAMCRGCEPEGVCRLADCPLRPFSPLPLEAHRQTGRPRTNAEIRVELNRKAAPARSLAMTAHLAAHPEHKAVLAAASARRHAEMTPADREAWVEKIAASKAARSPEERADQHRRAGETRRRRHRGDPMPEATA